MITSCLFGCLQLKDIKHLFKIHHLMIQYTRKSNSTVQEEKVDELVCGGRYFPGTYCVLF